jgi:AcrR family transcriptional regulator
MDTDMANADVDSAKQRSTEAKKRPAKARQNPTEANQRSSERQRDPERTRAEILQVATTEFARVGYSGARVDNITALTRTTKRMLYYYFGGKEQLYVAVLEEAYGDIRKIEQQHDLKHLSPVEAIRTLAELTFDYHDTHPEFIRLIADENVHNAEHLRASNELSGLNNPILGLIQSILNRGYREGVFHRKVKAVEVHTMMSALAFYRVSNQATVKVIFGYDMASPTARRRHRLFIAEMFQSWLQDVPAGRGKR